MAAAEVGDDVLDRDPTMRELENRVAGLLGASDALWTPSGSMGNLIALMQPPRPGRRLPRSGRRARARRRAGHRRMARRRDAARRWSTTPARARSRRPPCAGPPARPRAVLRAAHHAALPGEHPQRRRRHGHRARRARRRRRRGPGGRSCKVHLDGARLWHAAVALGVPPAALTVGADTVQVCLSKGLGAPVGFGGRRVGRVRGGAPGGCARCSAAGCARAACSPRPVSSRSTGSNGSAEDHDRASRLAAGLRERGWQVAVPQTNIVLVDGRRPRRHAAAGSRRRGCAPPRCPARCG